MADGLKQKIMNAAGNMSPAETTRVGMMIIAVVLVGLYLGWGEIEESLGETPRLIQARTSDLETLGRTLTRYQILRGRMDSIENSFKASQMTFEQVTEELDKVVKETIGSSEYDLKKIPNPSKIGLSYEKQQFTVNIKSLTLDQLVRLLHRLENGDRPLFLGKVDINKPAGNSAFTATLEVFSVRKAKA